MDLNGNKLEKLISRLILVEAKVIILRYVVKVLQRLENSCLYFSCKIELEALQNINKGIPALLHATHKY